MRDILLSKRKKLHEEYRVLLKKLEEMEIEQVESIKEKEKAILDSSIFYKILNRKEYISNLKEIKKSLEEISPDTINQAKFKKIKKRIKEISRLISSIDDELNKLENKRRK